MPLSLAEQAGLIEPSATLAMGAEAKRLKAQGRQILDFALGEPDFDTPTNIQEAAIRAIRSGQTHYTPPAGIPELRQAVAKLYTEHHGVATDPAQVVVSNGAKHAMIGVETAKLETFGAVSKEVAIAMAFGALEHADVDLAVAITGIAGPGGATPGKPVGLVHFAVAARDGRIIHHEQRFGAIGRSSVRQQSVIEALKMLIEMARGPKAPVKRSRAAVHRLRPRASRTPTRTSGKRRRTSRPSTPRASDS